MGGQGATQKYMKTKGEQNRELRIHTGFAKGKEGENGDTASRTLTKGYRIASICK